jgi:UDP-glucose:(heptosyl)LPS alpha-1,3-glucosyltransferase
VNIALFVRRWSRAGGTEKYTFDLAHALVRAGCRVRVYCAEVRVARDEIRASSPDINVTPLALPMVRGWWGRLAWIRAAARVPRQAFDIVLALDRIPGMPWFRAGGGVHAAWLEAAAHHPGGLPRRWSPVERVELALDRSAFASAEQVIFNSAMTRDDAVSRGLVSSERAVVIRNGVDLRRFAPDGRRREERRAALGVGNGRIAVFVGSAYRRKGLSTAIDAFARVAGSHDRLVIVGHDPRGSPLLRATQDTLGDRMHVVGHSDTPEHWMQAADAVVLPTRYDSAANTTLEALACGVPVVTTSKDGNAEITPEPWMVVQDPVSVEQVAAALDCAWSASDAVRAQCRRTAETWTVDRNAAEILRLTGKKS